MISNKCSRLIDRGFLLTYVVSISFYKQCALSYYPNMPGSEQFIDSEDETLGELYDGEDDEEDQGDVLMNAADDVTEGEDVCVEQVHQNL